MSDKEYQDFMKLSIEDLTFHASGSSTASTIEKAKFVLTQRMMQQEHEYAKKQIELQHNLNMKLIVKQLRWIKFSAILNALAILAAVVLGWYLQELKSQLPLTPPTQQSIQYKTEPSSTKSQVLHPEKKSDKETLTPHR
jgi:hypothetical protein